MNWDEAERELEDIVSGFVGKQLTSGLLEEVQSHVNSYLAHKFSKDLLIVLPDPQESDKIVVVRVEDLDTYKRLTELRGIGPEHVKSALVRCGNGDIRLTTNTCDSWGGISEFNRNRILNLKNIMNLRDLKKEVDEACARADRSSRPWDGVNIDLCLHLDGKFRRFKTRGIDITSTPKGFPAKLTVGTIEAGGGSENPLKEVDDKFIEELGKSIEFHQTNQDDAHGVGPAVVVSLIEVRRAFTEALKVRDSRGGSDNNHGQ